MKRYINAIIAFLAISALILSMYACTPRNTRVQTTPFSSIDIPGAFGYNFGNSLDKSMIVEKMVSENPRLFEEYLVKPIKRNKDFDIYSVTTCKRTGMICCIRGFTILRTRDQAMKCLMAVRPIIQNNYGSLMVKSSRHDYYEEFTGSISTRISLIVLSDSSGATFMIKYSNEKLKQQCQY
jgi:hypothetical protein